MANIQVGIVMGSDSDWPLVQKACATLDKFGAEELSLLKPDGIIMHPLPRRDEIAVCCDHDPRAMYWRQMRNGMWIRSALIATTFGLEDESLGCGY